MSDTDDAANELASSWLKFREAAKAWVAALVTFALVTALTAIANGLSDLGDLGTAIAAGILSALAGGEAVYWVPNRPTAPVAE